MDVDRAPGVVGESNAPPCVWNGHAAHVESPHRRRLALWISLALFFVCFWLLSIRMYAVLEWGDEGYFANAALRILSGEVIYRDFQNNYPPGRMYTLALLIKVFGQDLAVVRFFWVSCHAAAVALSFLVAKRLMALPFALAVPVTVLFNSLNQNKAVELLAASVILLVLARVLERRTSDFAAGAWLAVVAHYRHDVAVMGTIVFFLTLALQVAVEGGPAPYRSRLVRRLSQSWPYLAGCAVVGLPFTLYLLFTGAIGTGLRELALTGFEADQALSIPFPKLIHEWTPLGIWSGLSSPDVVYYIPLFVYAACLIYAGRRLIAGDAKLAAAQILVACAFGLFLFLQVLPRTDPGHLNKAYIPAHILSFVLIAASLGSAATHLRNRRLLRGFVLLVLAIPAVAMPIKQFQFNCMKERSLHDVLVTELFGHQPPYQLVELPRGRFKFHPRDARLMRQIDDLILQYADKKDEEYMLVFPAGAIFNFLYDTRSPIPYDALRPGELRNNDAEILDTVWKQITQARPRVLIFTTERTNKELGDRLTTWAREQGYRFHRGPQMKVWIRQGEEPIDGTSDRPSASLPRRAPRDLQPDFRAQAGSPDRNVLDKSATC